MSTKKIEPTAKRILVMDNGETYHITGETSKFYLCEGTQFRKSNPAIHEVQEVPPEAETNEAQSNAPKE